VHVTTSNRRRILTLALVAALAIVMGASQTGSAAAGDRSSTHVDKASANRAAGRVLGYFRSGASTTATIT
jgi:hypothetical protein